MATAHYQVARLGGVRTSEGGNVSPIHNVVAGATVTGIGTGADTTIDLAATPALADVTWNTVTLYVEALTGNISVKRGAGDVGWRLSQGAYAWFSLSQSQDLILREVT